MRMWPWPPPRRGDVVGFLLLAALLAAVLVAALFPSTGTNWGFGPEWRCSFVGKGDPVCIKKPAGASDKSPAS